MKKRNKRIVAVVLVISLALNVFLIVGKQQQKKSNEGWASNESARFYSYVQLYSSTLERMLENETYEETVPLLEEYGDNLLNTAFNIQRFRNNRVDDLLSAQLDLAYFLDVELKDELWQYREGSLNTGMLSKIQTELKKMSEEYTKVYSNREQSEKQKKEQQAKVLNTSLTNLYEITLED